MIGRPEVTRRTFLRVSFTAGGGLLIAALGACADDPAPPRVAGATTQPIATSSPATAAPLVTSTTAPATSGQGLDTSSTATTLPPTGRFVPNLFVRIDPDDTVTLTIHRSEMGQGVRTALAMVLADELDLDWSTVRIGQAVADKRFGSQVTSGSGSVTDNYSDLRDAAAEARQILVESAAGIWGVSAGECHTGNGSVIRTGTDQRLKYGELIQAATARGTKPAAAPVLKDPADFHFVGTSPGRFDDPAIVRGSAVYGIDVRLPKMLFATVARCPVSGGRVASFDAIKALGVPGIHSVVPISNGVAVVADNSWAAMRGRSVLDISFAEGDSAGLSSTSISKQLEGLSDVGFPADASAELTTIDARYNTPYLAHAPMEPINCVADWRNDGCDIWTSTQNPQGVQDFVAKAVGVPVVVHVTLLGGGFGRRLEVDFAVEAAEVSKAISTPVQVIWTREDDIRHDFYRMPTHHRMSAGWDGTGTIRQWSHWVAGSGINGVAYHAGRDVLLDGLDVSYRIERKRSDAVLAPVPLPTGPWRAVMNGPNAFANECFFDEVAVAIGKDPFRLRMELLSDSDRLRPTIELAATKAGWGTDLPPGHRHGIAGHTTYGSTPVAMVAEVSVVESTVRVHRVVCAIDCGRVIHPDMVVQQMEGGIVFGLTSLLKGQITIAAGRVVEGNFDDYPLLQMSEMPRVEVHIMPSDREPQGVGEMGVPPIVPAVLNGVFACTGKRIRHMPIRPGDL